MSAWPYDEQAAALRHIGHLEDALDDLDPEAGLQHINAAIDALGEASRALIVQARDKRPPVSWKRLGVLTGLNPRTLARWFA